MTDFMTTNMPVPEPVIDLVSDDESLEEGEIAEPQRGVDHQPLPAGEGEIPQPRVEIPTLDHRGRGILAGDFVAPDGSDLVARTATRAGDFIKPDPAMTRLETRRYVVAEMRRWLTESAIASHAREICATIAEPAEVAPLVAAGRWPAARLYLVLAALEAMPRGLVELPRDYEERFHAAARWAADVCEDYLHGYEAVIPAARMAVGFVTDDRLPNGETIASHWNYSPFEALRNAPPLSEDDPPQPEEEAVVPVAAAVNFLDGFLKQEFTVCFTGGQLSAFALAVTAYLWLVALAVNR